MNILKSPILKSRHIICYFLLIYGILFFRKIHLMQTVMVLVLEQFIQTVQGQKNFW